LTRTAYQVAAKFSGTKEVAGMASNPLVLAMLRLDNKWPEGDHVAWCSAFVNFIAWLLDLPRTRSLRARSWLGVGIPVHLEEAVAGYDVVILQRGEGRQPGPEVLEAPGHVGFFAGVQGDKVLLLGGNQSDSVSLQWFPASKVLGVRRLA
jgi:uncharacterized protein (TIGR02594 family)